MAATPMGLVPTGMVAPAAFVAVSVTPALPKPALVTLTAAPPEVIATPTGPLKPGMVAIVVREAVPITLTVPSPLFAT
jgi:hypothetical protein